MYSRNPLPTLRLRTEFWLLDFDTIFRAKSSSRDWIGIRANFGYQNSKSHYRLRELYSRSLVRVSVGALAPTLVTSMQHLVLGQFPICVAVSDNTNNKNVSFDEYPETETSGQPVAMMPEAKYCLCYAQTLILLCNCHQM